MSCQYYESEWKLITWLEKRPKKRKKNKGGKK